jgi:hypothetical protein
MNSTRISMCVMAGLAAVLMDDSPMPVRWNPGQAPSASSGIQPVLRLEKPRYVLGESIRFWVGVETQDSTKVAEALRKPCSLTAIRPDGSTKIESVGWPLDGIDGAGWTGGWGFGSDTVQEGTYTLDLECGIAKTPPVNLNVERNEIADQIKAQFLFPETRSLTPGDQVPVVLSVQNNSRHTIRFAKRGSIEESISLRVVSEEPYATSEFFYPREKLDGASTSAPAGYSWRNASEVPSVVLRPGEHFEQRLLLNHAYAFEKPGYFQVTFSTVLAVLVGERDGEFRDLCPIRLPAEERARFVVTGPPRPSALADRARR